MRTVQLLQEAKRFVAIFHFSDIRKQPDAPGAAKSNHTRGQHRARKVTGKCTGSHTAVNYLGCFVDFNEYGFARFPVFEQQFSVGAHEVSVHPWLRAP